MNKNLRSYVLVILSILMLLSLGACRKEKKEAFNPADAFALWDKIDETMNSTDSMEINSNKQILFYSGGYAYTTKVNSYTFASKQTHYFESTIQSICEELSIDQKTVQIEAYHDGKMYIATDDGTLSQKLCSEMTHEEYDAVESGELTEDMDIKDCTTSSFKKLDNGGWELHFSNYTKKTISKMLDSMHMTDNMLGAPITDIEVDLIADENFCVEKMTVNLVFDTKEGEAIPSFSVVSQYGGYGTAVFDTARLNVEEYTLADDVRILTAVMERLQERQDAVSGKFSLDMKTTYVMQGQTSTSQETDTIAYGWKNGAYFYDITGQIDGQNMVLRYQNSEQIVTIGEQTNTAAQTEGEAKTFIDGLMDTGSFTPLAVSDIKMQSDGVFALTCAQLDVTKYNAMMAGNGVQIASGTQECMVTFAQNKLMKIESKITLIGQYAGEEMSMCLESVVVFDDSEVSS